MREKFIWSPGYEMECDPVQEERIIRGINQSLEQLEKDWKAIRADMTDDNKPDLVNHPPHYTQHPSGIECIQVTEHLNFCRGNAIKYIWRAGEKGSEIEDLKKAAWYINREIARLEKQQEVPT